MFIGPSGFSLSVPGLEIERGGLLGVHADFIFYKRMQVWRRLNVLIYLNTEWDEAWGGHLELWEAERKTCV